MRRPDLNEISLDETMNELIAGKPMVFITMSIGQWNNFLQSAYDLGHNLIELDEKERPVAAYRKGAMHC